MVRQGETHAGLVAAAATTSSIFDELLRRVGNIPVVFFIIDAASPPFAPVARKLADDHHFIFVNDVPEYLNRARRVHAVIECADRVHLNTEGHRLIAKALLPALVPLPPRR